MAVAAGGQHEKVSTDHNTVDDDANRRLGTAASSTKKIRRARDAAQRDERPMTDRMMVVLRVGRTETQGSPSETMLQVPCGIDPNLELLQDAH